MMKFRAWEVCAFCLVVLLLVIWVNDVFEDTDHRIHEWIADFYNEPPHTLDVVTIGPSSMFSFWQPALAWEAFGTPSWNLTSPAMPYTAPIQMVKEALKTQKPKVFVVEAGTFLNKPAPERIHFLSHNMPWSPEKLALIESSCREMGVEGLDRLEYFFPLVRFHSRWYSLRKEDFVRSRETYKGSSHYSLFLMRTGKFEYDYMDSEETEPIEKKQLDSLTEFLDYCKEKCLNVVFLAAPNTKDNKDELRYIQDVVEGYGYPFVMSLKHKDEIGLVIPDDFYNESHTNLSGSIKCVAWFGKYLSERYDLPDRRGEKGYESWEEASEGYLKKIEPHVDPRALEVLGLI